MGIREGKDYCQLDMHKKLYQKSTFGTLEAGI